MTFTTRRGRPPKPSFPAGADLGTPELSMKRTLGVTDETIDLCLARTLIDHDQHWCGVHLRWLYTLRYGAPGVRAVDPTHLGGILRLTDDPDWRREREKEYHDAVQLLDRARLLQVALNACVYNTRPAFLALPPKGKLTATYLAKREHELARLQDALDLLAVHWGRKKRRH